MEPNLSFISYSRRDSEFVVKLAEDLKAAGLQIWLDKLDITPGNSWASEIEKALQESDCIIVVLSTASAQSENVLDEIHYAIETKKKIIPLLLAPCKIPFRIQRLQYIDFTTDYAVAFQRLTKTIKSAFTAEETVTKEDGSTVQKKDTTHEDLQTEDNDDRQEEKKKINFKIAIPVLLIIFIILIIIVYKTTTSTGSSAVADTTGQRLAANTAPAAEDSTLPLKTDSNKIGSQTTSTTGTTQDTPKLPARVYLTLAQGNTIDNTLIVSKLKDAGFTIPNTPRVRSTNERELISVNYYYEEDKEEAERLLQIIKQLCLPRQPAGTTKLTKGTTRRRHYDVWITLK